jgi:potassium/chloride transporter 9
MEKSISNLTLGTIWGLAFTASLYIISVLIIGSCIPRSILEQDPGYLHSWSILPEIYTLGVFTSAFSSVFGGIHGTAIILQSVLKDQILPLPVWSYATCVSITFWITQSLLIVIDEVELIAPLVTQSNLLCFAIINLACFLLRIAGAPNFRPSFRYFNRFTAFLGLISCIVSMFWVDVSTAWLCFLLEIVLFILVHFFGEPKNWGDVSQSLMYHQVRKFLLKMDRYRQLNVKLWRPHILLLVPHNNSSDELFQFINHLKKGSLFLIAQVLIGKLEEQIGQYRLMNTTWGNKIEQLRVKAFIQVDISPDLRQGARSLMLGAGLGSMQIIVLVCIFMPFDRSAVAPSLHAVNINYFCCRYETKFGVAHHASLTKYGSLHILGNIRRCAAARNVHWRYSQLSENTTAAQIH